MSIDDEYEYEYSTTETETFLVDLDFSTVNGVIKSKNAGDRKTLKAPQASTDDPASKQVQPSNENDDDDDIDEPQPEGASPEEVHSPQEPKILDDFGDNIQILDLHTPNPIVSYRNNIYSCKWTDMIGTNMFFTTHQEAPLHEPEIATEDYDLVGTSRIKLVGHRAVIAPKPIPSKRRHPNNDGQDEMEEHVEQYIPPGRSLGGIKRTNPRTNIEIKQQANFLERLIDIKKARGDSDTVRTFVDRHMIAAESKRKSEATAVQKEIEELNRRVIHGDNDALERLQDIYSRMEEAESDEDQPAPTDTVQTKPVRQSTDPPVPGGVDPDIFDA